MDVLKQERKKKMWLTITSLIVIIPVIVLCWVQIGMILSTQIKEPSQNQHWEQSHRIAYPIMKVVENAGSRIARLGTRAKAFSILKQKGFHRVCYQLNSRYRHVFQAGFTPELLEFTMNQLDRLYKLRAGLASQRQKHHENGDVESAVKVDGAIALVWEAIHEVNGVVGALHTCRILLEENGLTLEDTVRVP